MHLPGELLVHILGKLDCKDLLRCIRVCKNFKDIIDGTAALQYIIELAASGQRDNSLYESEDSSKEKLEKLRKHQEAWKELQWSRNFTIPMSSGGLWELYGGVLAQNTEQGEIQFYQLPSDLRGIEEKRWTLPGDFGFTIRDFGMDPRQDLLVLVENLDAPESDGSSMYHVHFYTMSTGKPHPLASRSKVTIPQTPFDPNVFHSIQVFGDLVGIQFCPLSSDENVIALWNWKSGELQIFIYGEDLGAFTLLSERWMLFAFSDETEVPRLNVVDYAKERWKHCAIDQLETSFELECPPLSNREVYLTEMQLRADPGCFVDSKLGGPFVQDTKDFLIVFTTSLTVRDHDRHVIQFISAQRLLEGVEAYAPFARDSHGDLRPPVPYTEWMKDTRIQVVGKNEEPSDVWVCNVYGNRYILAAPMFRDGVFGLELEVLDFNQRALKRDAHPSRKSGYSGYVKTQPNQIPPDKPFIDEIETCLPYRRQSWFLEDVHAHCKAMCTEDSIVIVDEDCREYRVLVF